MIRLRLRLELVGGSRRALVLTDTPRPDCADCGGEGGWEFDYGDYDTGEYAGTEWDPCPCWNDRRRWVLLRPPRFPYRRSKARDPWAPYDDGYSNEPPF
jgi:hypothetical protein